MTSAPFTVSVAERVRAFAWTVSPAGSSAWLVTFASVIATAAPIVAVAPCEADPSALVAASVFAGGEGDEPAGRERDAGSVQGARDAVVARSTPTAAATFTLPSEVDALGVVAEPDAAPPCAALVARRCRAASSPAGRLRRPAPRLRPRRSRSAVLGGARRRRDGVAAEPRSRALNATAPPAVIERAVVAVTASLAMVSARAMPIAAVRAAGDDSPALDVGRSRSASPWPRTTP